MKKMDETNHSTMADDADDAAMAEAAEAAASAADEDFFDHEPTKQEKIEMRKAAKPPSEWLKLLCRDWFNENQELAYATDRRFLEYKSYLKGMISSQLLVKLSVPPVKEIGDGSPSPPPVDFWGILGIEDDFDRAFIVAQIERFCAFYSIRAASLDDVDGLLDEFGKAVDGATAIAAAGISVSPSGGITLPPYMDPNTAAAVSAAAAAAVADVNHGKLTKKQAAEVSKAHKMAKDAEKALETERRQTIKREQRRLSMERKEQRAREREAVAVRKASERAAREATREERRRKKLEMRMQRERFAQEQKDAALKRAAELVQSNRVPIEITRGAAAAKAAANAAMGAVPQMEEISKKKGRSSIVVSTAYDLHQIVTHSKNLWTKYNAIAKEHNQRVNWITVARELGIHVKVREKYARMHSRAEQRGFDWERHGHYKIKDYPHIFLQPTQAEQKAKMPPPPPDPRTTDLVDAVPKDITHDVTADDAVAAAAAVVDAAVKIDGVDAVEAVETHATAAAVAAGEVAVAAVSPLVADPTAGLVDHTIDDEEHEHEHHLQVEHREL